MHPDIELRAAPAAGTRSLCGLMAGTTVLTLDGELPVETLAEGDRIITRDSGMSILREVRAFEVETSAVRIKASTLGHTRPDTDLVLPRDTLIHLRDWRAEALYGEKTALVPVHRLIDGEFVSAQPVQTAIMFELVFDQQRIVYANGVEVATASH